MSKVVINGKKVEGCPKMVRVPVNGKELDLTLVYVNDSENPIKWDWKPVPGNDKLVAKTAKSGNRVATTIEFGGIPVFTNLTAQSVFAVINAKFSQPISTTDSIYKKCNPLRKESKGNSGSARMVITEKGSW
jgi:hypothetical protein